ncbi:hypothetical protein ACF0H5_018665 [Mactra antiquata]
MSKLISHQNTEDISSLSKQVEEGLSGLQTARDIYKAELTTLDFMKTKVKKKLAWFKKEMIKILDKMEEATLKALERDVSDYITQIDHQFKEHEDELKKHKDNFDGIKIGDQNAVINVTEVERLCSKTTEFVDKIKYGQFDLDFIPDAKLKEFSSCETMGDVSINMKRNGSKPYAIKSIEEICDGKVEDHTTRNISSICILVNGDIMLADSFNKSVTRYKCSTFRETACAKFLSYPWDMCVTASNELAVTFPEEIRNVRFLRTVRGLKQSRSLHLRHTCRGIDYFEEELFVTDQGIFVYIYTIDGVLLRKFSRDTTYKLQSDYRTISVSKRLIVLIDWEEGLIAFDREGKLLWKRNHNLIRRASGVCFDEYGNIFICSSRSLNIIQIDTYGTVIGEIAGTNQGIVRPTCVCFDTRKSTMIVGQQGAKTIKLKVV